MEKEDLEFLTEILNESAWFLYGDLDEYFDGFLRRVFAKDLRDWGFSDVELEPTFAVAYWLLISELVRLDLVEYGTSPRGAWLTEKGERFKSLVMKHDGAIAQAEDFIHKKYNS